MKKNTEKKPIANRGYVIAMFAGFALSAALPLLAPLALRGETTYGAFFDKYGALLGAAFVALYLLIRLIARSVVKKKKNDPAYFRGKMTIMKYEKSLGMGMLVFSVLTAILLILIGENVFWSFVIGFPGIFIPFSRFLLTDKPMQQNDAGVIKT